MKFSLSAAVIAFAVSVAALPQQDYNAAGNGIGNKGNSNVRFPVPSDMTIKQATEKCGDQAQLSCCNKVTYTGDSTNIDSGILAGTLKNLIGGGSGQGLGLFDQCSKLGLQVPVIGVPVQDLVNQQCKQNIACCQNSAADAGGSLIGVALPCVALGSIL